MILLGWVSVKSESSGSYHEFVDLSFEAGPSAQCFFNESSWMGFCSIWKLMILPRVLGFVFWSWAFGPAFFKWVFLDGFLLNLKVKDLTTSSWICLLELGLRPSVFFNESSWMGFCLIWKLRILPRVLGFVFWSWAFGPAFFLISLLWLVSV